VTFGRYSLSVAAGSSVLALKQQLQLQCDVPVERQRLLHKGRDMDNQAQLSSYSTGARARLAVCLLLLQHRCLTPPPPAQAPTLFCSWWSSSPPPPPGRSAHAAARARRVCFDHIDERVCFDALMSVYVLMQLPSVSVLMRLMQSTSVAPDGTAPCVVLRGTITIPVPEGDVHRVVSR